MKLILQKILALLARLVIARQKPVIVGITGSVGKTSAREAVFAVVSAKMPARRAEKNYNNEIGFPLTVLGEKHGGKNLWKWFKIILKSMGKIFKRSADYPRVLILEYGIDRPGDMDYLLKIARPDIAVVTAMGEVPVHVEFFKDPKEVVREKTKLPAAVGSRGLVVLNADDSAVIKMKEFVSAGVISFGFQEKTDVRVINYEFRKSLDKELGEIPDGISFKIANKGRVVPVRLHNCFGKPQAYAAAAAAAVGIRLGMNLVEISEALGRWDPPPGRLRLLKGNKHSFILDDTYNASPESVRAALHTLKFLPGQRKIAVLGDMLELGNYTEIAHRMIGEEAANFADLILTVGVRAKFMAEEALNRKTREEVLEFDSATEAGKVLDLMLKVGDLVLVKGSQGMRMEKTVEEIMAHPERKSELLVRQEKYWAGN